MDGFTVEQLMEKEKYQDIPWFLETTHSSADVIEQRKRNILFFGLIAERIANPIFSTEYADNCIEEMVASFERMKYTFGKLEKKAQTAAAEEEERYTSNAELLVSRELPTDITDTDFELFVADLNLAHMELDFARSANTKARKDLELFESNMWVFKKKIEALQLRNAVQYEPFDLCTLNAAIILLDRASYNMPDQDFDDAALLFAIMDIAYVMDGDHAYRGKEWGILMDGKTTPMKMKEKVIAVCEMFDYNLTTVTHIQMIDRMMIELGLTRNKTQEWMNKATIMVLSNPDIYNFWFSEIAAGMIAYCYSFLFAQGHTVTEAFQLTKTFTNEVCTRFGLITKRVVNCVDWIRKQCNFQNPKFE